MNSLNAIPSEKLIESTRSLIAQERELTLQILEHLAEIERRRIYLDRGFSSLFEMCLREFGYSESQAYRRITAMRVSREVPETRQALQEGTLTLASVAMAQQFFRAESSSRSAPVPLEEKRAVLAELCGKSKREAERLLAERSTVDEGSGSEIVSPGGSNERPLKGGRTQVEVILSDAQVAKLRRLQELLSHQIPDGDWGRLLEKMADLLLERMDPVRKVKRRVSQGPASAPLSPGKVENARSSLPSRFIPAGIRRQTWVRAGSRCEFTDPRTGRRCASRLRLEIDHLTPVALGGASTPTNLQLLCRAHNVHRAIQCFGVRKMKRWLKA